MTATLLVRLVFWLWFAAAVFAGHSLVLQRLPAPVVPGMVFTLTALLLLAYFRLAGVRAWVDALPLRTLVLVHATRFVGIVFLVLYHRGQLPYAFAVPGGIGDIVIATFALPVALAPLEASSRLRATNIWNVAGLADILFVVVTAIRINLADPTEMHALTHLPLSLLPTFLVPLLIATHVIIFTRISRSSDV